MNPLPPAIRARGLTKRFGRRRAVDDATFEIPARTVTGFVGPNGAGKTTTLRILLGLVKPTGGTAEVLGHPITEPWTYLPRVGALIEGPAFYPGLSGRENLEVLTTLGRISTTRVDAALELVDLADRAADPYKAYSLGMKQRLGIAAAMLREPDLLILDEPTNGLDPAGMHEMRRLVARIGALGPAVLVSSHLLSEIETACSWLVIVDRGRLAYQGPTTALLADATSAFVVATTDDASLDALAGLVTSAGHLSQRQDGRLRVEAPLDFVPMLSRQAAAAGIVLTELTPVTATLEDRFLELTGRTSR
jgi:ABC-2 type transport system ATP-binding protein